MACSWEKGKCHTAMFKQKWSLQDSKSKACTLLSAREASPRALCSPAGTLLLQRHGPIGESSEERGENNWRSKNHDLWGKIEHSGVVCSEEETEGRQDNSLPVYKRLQQRGREQSVFHDQKDKKKLAGKKIWVKCQEKSFQQQEQWSSRRGWQELCGIFLVEV